MKLRATKILLVLCLEIVCISSFPSPGGDADEDWSAEPAQKRQSKKLDEKTKAILARARSVTKPKGIR